MSEEERPLSSADHIKKQFYQMRPLMKIAGLFDKGLREKLGEAEEQFAHLLNMEADHQRFAERFGPLGWTLHDNGPTDLVSAAVAEAEQSRSEDILTEHYLGESQLERLGYRFKTPKYCPWGELYERASERLSADDFISAVPLILIIIDGICLSKTQKHPFSGGADAPVFDSYAAGPGGLSAGLAVLGKTRRGLNTEALDKPFRHGIMHGINPSFGSAVVAAKAVNLLHAMVDYFDRMDDEEERIERAKKDQSVPSISDLAAKIYATEDTKRRVDEWRPRNGRADELVAASDDTCELEKESPEAAAADYLDAILAKNFGKIAAMTIDFAVRPLGYRAGRHRDELGELEVMGWEIRGVSDKSPAVSEVNCYLSGTLNGRQWSGVQTMRLVFGDENFSTLVRGAPNGSWAIMPNFLPGIWATALKSMRDDHGASGAD